MSPLTVVIGNKNYSSWSLRGWLAVRATGQPFDEVLLPLDSREYADQIARWSPSGRVPALRHGEITVWDSLAICEYLAETYPEAGLWPADSSARAVARSAAAEMHSGFQALRTNMPMNIRADRPGQGMAPGVKEDIARIRAIWGDCRARYGAGGDVTKSSFKPDSLGTAFDGCMQGVAKNWKLPETAAGMSFQSTVTLSPS